MKRIRTIGTVVVVLGAAAAIVPGWYPGHHAQAANTGATLVAPGLVLPRMNPQHGKELFASKGCVVCHSIHGVGGTDAPALDASTMDPVMNPFDFFAKMWRGAEPMIAMQNNELGHQIEFTGEDLADIVAFVHNRAVQSTFSERDIPPEIKKLMEEDESDGGMGMHMKDDGGGMMNEDH